MSNPATANYPLRLKVECPDCRKFFAYETALVVKTTRKDDSVLVEIWDHVPCQCPECGAYWQIAMTDYELKFGLEKLETI